MPVDRGFVLPTDGFKLPKVSVIIPSRNEFPIFYLSIFSCVEELIFWGYPFEIVFVSNCCTDNTPEILEGRFGKWIKHGRFKLVKFNDKGSLHVARNKGVEAATGDVCFMLDAHISVSVGTIHGMVQGWLKHGGVWHTCVNSFSDLEKTRLHGYRLTLEKNFWGAQSFAVPAWAKDETGKVWPYTIPMASYCSVLFGRSDWERARGMHPGFRTYSGGEGYFSMKAWQLGIPIWLYPWGLVRHDTWGINVTRKEDGTLKHSRKYTWTNEDIWHNFMIASYANGGEPWLEKVMAMCLERCNGVQRYIDGVHALRAEAVGKAEEDRRWIREHSKYPTFDDMVAEAPWNDPSPV